MVQGWSEMKIQNLIQMLTYIPQLSFCDLIGQNRLGNHRWLMKNHRSVKKTSNTFTFSLFAEMAKTESGRKHLRKFIKLMKPGKINKTGRNGRRFQLITF